MVPGKMLQKDSAGRGGEVKAEGCDGAWRDRVCGVGG
jgi:hypothetical protein